MKKILQSVLGLLMILALAMAVLWLVRNAPNPSQKSLAQATVTPNQQASVTITSIPKATPHDKVTPTATIEPSIEPTTRPTTSVKAQSAVKPTATPASELNFDTLKVVSVEEINPSPGQSVGTLADGKSVPVGRRVDWSPDGQKALVARELTYPHVLSRSSEETYSPLSAMDLWAWDQKTGQEILVTDKAYYWDWSPDSRAVIYITSIGEEGLDGELHIFDLDTKTNQKIVDTDITQAYPGPFWLSSGEIIYMDEARLWIMQPDGSNRRLLNDLQIYRDEAVDAGRDEYSYAPDKVGGRLYLSPDETHIAYEVFPTEPYRDSQLRIVDLAGNDQVRISGNTFFYDWDGDGTFFLYGNKLGDGYSKDLWITNVDGSNSRRLINAIEWGKEIAKIRSNAEGIRGNIGEVTLAPNNKLIVFSELGGVTFWILDISSGKWHLLYQNEKLKPLRTLVWLTNDELIASIISGPLRTDQKNFRLRLGE